MGNDESATEDSLVRVELSESLKKKKWPWF